MKLKWRGELSKLDEIPLPTSVERLGSFKKVMWMRWELVRLNWEDLESLVTHMPEEHIQYLERRISLASAKSYKAAV